MLSPAVIELVNVPPLPDRNVDVFKETVDWFTIIYIRPLQTVAEGNIKVCPPLDPVNITQ